MTKKPEGTIIRALYGTSFPEVTERAVMGPPDIPSDVIVYGAPFPGYGSEEPTGTGTELYIKDEKLYADRLLGIVESIDAISNDMIEWLTQEAEELSEYGQGFHGRRLRAKVETYKKVLATLIKLAKEP